jgi:peptidoglycan glycosyltransferase
MTRELNRVTLAILALFGVIALSVLFWSVIQSDSMLARPDNLRQVIADQQIRRGTIYDRNGEPLAYGAVLESTSSPRVYPHPEAVGAVGYYSYQFGAAGIEAAFDGQLRGDGVRNDWQIFVDEMLHRTPRGSDVRSTIDLGVQQAATDALGRHRGAVVVVEVPSGRVLAMVSRPSYDPNRLLADWTALNHNRQVSPLLNRVTTGLYQPGGVLQTVMLAMLLSSTAGIDASGGQALNGEVDSALDPLQVNGLALGCLEGTPETALTLAEAYAYGCPAPFVAAIRSALPPDSVWERLRMMGLLTAPELAGFETASGPRPDRLSAATPADEFAAAVAGQGDLTVTPLQMAQFIAVIANQGNTVPLHLVDEIRKPGSSTWEAVPLPVRQPALLRADVAAAVQLAMRQAVEISPLVSQAQRAAGTLYGHVALAYGGPPQTPYVWFTGFIVQPQGGTLVAVVVVENEADAGLAARVAGAAFAAAE